MGQHIVVDSIAHVDDSIIVSTDRSLTGTDGEGYESADSASGVDTFAAKLAVDMFESDASLSRIFVASNVVVAKRDGGWPSEAQSATQTVIEDFFLFYPAT